MEHAIAALDMLRRGSGAAATSAPAQYGDSSTTDEVDARTGRSAVRTDEQHGAGASWGRVSDESLHLRGSAASALADLSTDAQPTGSARYDGAALSAWPPHGCAAFGCVRGSACGAVASAHGARSARVSGQNAFAQRGLMLHIVEHTVHRIDHVQATPSVDLRRSTHAEIESVRSDPSAGSSEHVEMVVSNLRLFTLAVALIGVDGERVTALPDGRELLMRAELIYENGLPVDPLGAQEPPLVGKTELPAVHGQANFRLRITSLSSHRDRQRFRVRVTAVDARTSAPEPGLSAVTKPMKCVTKLATTRASLGGAGAGAGVGADGVDIAAMPAGAEANGALGMHGRAGANSREAPLSPLSPAQGAQACSQQPCGDDAVLPVRAKRGSAASAMDDDQPRVKRGSTAMEPAEQQQLLLLQHHHQHGEQGNELDAIQQAMATAKRIYGMGAAFGGATAGDSAHHSEDEGAGAVERRPAAGAAGAAPAAAGCGPIAQNSWLRDMREVHAQIEAEIAALKQTVVSVTSAAVHGAGAAVRARAGSHP